MIYNTANLLILKGFFWGKSCLIATYKIALYEILEKFLWHIFVINFLRKLQASKL